MNPTKDRPLGRPKNDSGLAKGWCGAALTARRLLESMSLEYLANECGISTSAVSRWESGECSPTATQVLVLANLFECRVTAFSREPRDKVSIALLALKRGRPRHA